MPTYVQKCGQINRKQFPCSQSRRFLSPSHENGQNFFWFIVQAVPSTPECSRWHFLALENYNFNRVEVKTIIWHDNMIMVEHVSKIKQNETLPDTLSDFHNSSKRKYQILHHQHSPFDETSECLVDANSAQETRNKSI